MKNHDDNTYSIVAEYIWLGGKGEIRSKARTLMLTNIDKLTLDHIPQWNFDGSSTGQASGSDSEVIIKPCSFYHCPFRRNDSENILVMCDTYRADGTPLGGNTRHWAKEIFDKNLGEEPWYGIEQEFFIFDSNTKKPLGFPWEGMPLSQGQYYCSVGHENAFGRQIIETHYEHCLYAGLSISGINAEVAPGQWEYQIGPVEGIEAGDQLYVSRYILKRVAEKFNFYIDFEPKPILGEWNGSGCHTNFSTKAMREGTINLNNKTGISYINDAIEKLSLKHKEHMKMYGAGNELRMTGQYETSSFDKFSYGIGNRGASVRIPNETVKNKCGYFEDRRPSSNMDPYLVTGILFKTTVNDE